MGALIPILIRLLAQASLTIFISGLSFLGYETSSLSSLKNSTSAKTNAPILVDVQNKNVSVPKDEPKAVTPTTTPTTTPTKKVSPQKEKIKTPVIKEKTTPTQVQTIPVAKVEPTHPKTSPTITSPSLANLPTPTIQLPNSIQKNDFGIWNDVYENARESVVNILCLSKQGNMVSISTGSGVIINPQGIIITNAHVAENFLIPNKECTIRSGDIASDKYKASLVYINETWLQKNAGVIFSSVARGTGEDDFALIAITSDMNGQKLNGGISYNQTLTNEMTEGNKNKNIFATGYPGGTLGALSLQKFLPFTADATKLLDIFTFDGSHFDILETAETKVGQRGSSGGGIFDESGKLVGLIVSTNGEGSADKINALTLPYINRAFKNETGKSLGEFTSTDKTQLLSSFALKQNSLFEYVKPFVK